MRKQSVPTGKEYLNKKGITAKVIMEVSSTNRNRLFKCQITDESGTVEVKDLQKCQLINGRFDFTKYQDRELYRVSKTLFSNINTRIKKAKSYKNVVNKFNSVLELYDFVVEFTGKNPHHYRNIILNKYCADKDMLSFLLYGEVKKEYSKDTLIFISTQDNNLVKAILNRNIAKEEKEKKLNQILSFYNLN